GSRLAAHGQQFATSGASAIAYAATRSLATGTSFGDNIIASLPSVIGQTIGAGLIDLVTGGFAGTSRTGKATDHKDSAPTNSKAGELVSRDQLLADIQADMAGIPRVPYLGAGVNGSNGGAAVGVPPFVDIVTSSATNASLAQEARFIGFDPYEGKSPTATIKYSNGEYVITGNRMNFLEKLWYDVTHPKTQILQPLGSWLNGSGQPSHYGSVSGWGAGRAGAELANANLGMELLHNYSAWSQTEISPPVWRPYIASGGIPMSSIVGHGQPGAGYTAPYTKGELLDAALMATGGAAEIIAARRAGVFTAEVAVPTASRELVPLATKSLGEWGETRLANYLGGLGVKPGGAFKTPLGPRYADRVLAGISYESKAGLNVKLTSAINRQIAKDTYLIKTGQIRGAEWHFWRGVQPEVLQALQDAGIKSVVH
ncbi:hypothetical protein, partial [Sphingomonas gilva]|uniref:hypothetical protein n=1 Tax=Sphingomonas gilva TaxID=2305907 RepID=UPI0015F8A471